MPLARFAPLDSPSADDLNGLGDQLAPTFANASERATLWPTPHVGARSVLLDDPGNLWGFLDGQWVVVLDPSRIAFGAGGATNTGVWFGLHPLVVWGSCYQGRRYRARISIASADRAWPDVGVAACPRGSSSPAFVVMLGGGANLETWGNVTVAGDFVAEDDWPAVGPACDWRVWITSGRTLYVQRVELEVADLGPAEPMGGRR